MKFDPWKLQKHNALDSTSLEARRLIEAAHDVRTLHQTVIQTDVQTAGKGRSDNRWLSESGNLFFSVILCYEKKTLEEISGLSLVTALAVRKIIAEMLDNHIQVECKWPNDILIEGKKVSGILLESLIKENVTAVILGIGINTCISPNVPDKPVTSLSRHTKEIPDNMTVCSRFLEQFSEYESRWREHGISLIAKEWYQYAFAKNKTITVRLPQEQHSGIFIGISESGLLRLQLSDNTIKEISSGEVFFV